MTFFHLIMIIGITQAKSLQVKSTWTFFHVKGAVEMKVTWNFSRELNYLYPHEIFFSRKN